MADKMGEKMAGSGHHETDVSLKSSAKMSKFECNICGKV